jgi:hypothetical protein
LFHNSWVRRANYFCHLLLFALKLQLLIFRLMNEISEYFRVTCGMQSKKVICTCRFRSTHRSLMTHDCNAVLAAESARKNTATPRGECLKAGTMRMSVNGNRRLQVAPVSNLHESIRSQKLCTLSTMVRCIFIHKTPEL